MKKMFVFFAAAALLGLLSCTKQTTEGPQGATGPAGPAGPAGKTDSLYITDTSGLHLSSPDWFAVTTASWVRDTTNSWYKISATYTGLTTKAVNSGLVQLYMLEATNTWTALPITLGHLTFSYRFYPGGFDLFAQGPGETLPTAAPPTAVYRLIVISQKTAIVHPDWKSQPYQVVQSWEKNAQTY